MEKYNINELISDIDFNANALRKVGIKDAIYLDMGTWSDGFVRLKDKTIFSIGHLKYNTKYQTNWLRYIYEPSKQKKSSKAIRTSNQRKPKKKK